MKKIMKAIAFATVMCMLLSTVAFAAQEAVVNEAKTGVNVTVGAAEGTQVALLILVKGTALENAATGNILYVDQKAAAATGATFTDVNIGTAKSADVFVGYEGNQTVALGTVTFEAGDTIIVTTVKKYESIEGETDNDLGGGYVVDLTSVLDEGRTIKDLIWAIDWTKNVEGEEVASDTAYIDAREMLDEINVLSGNARIGIAFAAGAKKTNAYNVTLADDVRVIAKTTGAGLPDKEFVPEKDKVKKSGGNE